MQDESRMYWVCVAHILAEVIKEEDIGIYGFIT